MKVVLRALLIVALCWATTGTGCADRRTDDADLGGLVVAKAKNTAAISVELASSDVTELRRALASSHQDLLRSIGAHTLQGTSRIILTKEGNILSDLSDQTSIKIDNHGNYHATVDNNQNYGRHAIFVDGTLYLRPRFGKYHRRAPASRDEPADIRNQMFSTVAAHFDLLFSHAELSPGAKVMIGSRAGQAIRIKISPTAIEHPRETLAHRKWRESISVEDVKGEVVLDYETGYPLRASVIGKISFTKEGTLFSMTLESSHEVTGIGDIPPIQAPPLEMTMSAPTITNETANEHELLDGLGGLNQAKPVSQ